MLQMVRRISVIAIAAAAIWGCNKYDFKGMFMPTGEGVQTLSMTIYSMARKRITPSINALSTILFVSVLVLLIIVNVREFRQEERLKKQARLAKK